MLCRFLSVLALSALYSGHVQAADLARKVGAEHQLLQAVQEHAEVAKKSVCNKRLVGAYSLSKTAGKTEANCHKCVGKLESGTFTRWKIFGGDKQFNNCRFVMDGNRATCSMVTTSPNPDNALPANTVFTDECCHHLGNANKLAACQQKALRCRAIHADRRWKAASNAQKCGLCTAQSTRDSLCQFHQRPNEAPVCEYVVEDPWSFTSSPFEYFASPEECQDMSQQAMVPKYLNLYAVNTDRGRKYLLKRQAISRRAQRKATDAEVERGNLNGKEPWNFVLDRRPRNWRTVSSPDDRFLRSLQLTIPDCQKLLSDAELKVYNGLAGDLLKTKTPLKLYTAIRSWIHTVPLANPRARTYHDDLMRSIAVVLGSESTLSLSQLLNKDAGSVSLISMLAAWSITVNHENKELVFGTTARSRYQLFHHALRVVRFVLTKLKEAREDLPGDASWMDTWDMLADGTKPSMRDFGGLTQVPFPV